MKFNKVYCENAAGERILDFYQLQDDPCLQIQVLRDGAENVAGYAVNYYDGEYMRQNGGSANIDIVRTLKEVRTIAENFIKTR